MSEVRTIVKRCDRCCEERDIATLPGDDVDVDRVLQAEGWLHVIIHLGGLDLCPQCARRVLSVLVQEAPHAEGKPAGTIIFGPASPGTPKHIGFFTPKQVFREATEVVPTQNETGRAHMADRIMPRF